MPAHRISRCLLLTIILLLIFCKTYAQQRDGKTFQHKMRLMDSLSFYKMDGYDTLKHVFTVDTMYGHTYKQDYYGWARSVEDYMILLCTDGRELKIDKWRITAVKVLPINDATISIFTRPRKEDPFYFMDKFGADYLLVLWLYKKSKPGYSQQLLREGDALPADTTLRDNFGIIYYDDMLSAMSMDRDYAQAIVFGAHLSGRAFKGYKYQQEAIALTRQLKDNSEDFKAFHQPDSVEWAALKKKLNKKEQVLYLAERLRLLNCIQPGQPGGISYSMDQFSVSMPEATKNGVSYWGHGTRYRVINPYVELVEMKLSPGEIQPLLPYLLKETYIPSYSYFRDFRPERTVHKLSWVVESLIFECTTKHFLKNDFFTSLSLEQKKVEVEEIRKWCEENASSSRQELTIAVLKSTDNWSEFQKVLATARQEKYELLLPAIVGRYNDFKAFYSPVHKWLIAQTMFELGDERYLGTVKQWNKDTTDLEVNLWTSLFLLKNDKGSYEHAMAGLETVLEQCDGSAYYPHAMDLLLSMNDNRALKLAEGILAKPQFQRFLMFGDYYINFIKKLLALKSDYTFNYIQSKLVPFSAEDIKTLRKATDGVSFALESDTFVSVVDALKDTKHGYYSQNTIKAKADYKKALKQWFGIQYKLLKEGKPNQLHLDIVKAYAPVSFVDSPN